MSSKIFLFCNKLCKSVSFTCFVPVSGVQQTQTVLFTKFKGKEVIV